MLLVRLLNVEGEEGDIGTAVIGLRRMNELTPRDVNTLALCNDDGTGGVLSMMGVLGYDIDGEDLPEDVTPSTRFKSVAPTGLSTTRENLKSFSGRL